MSPHREQLVAMVQKHGWTKGAELGVDKGLLFQMLLSRCPDLHLIGVDTCPVPHRKAKCEAIAAQYAERAELLVMTTDEAAALVPDRSLDFVFIDADHSFKSVQSDIRHWLPKVRRGGRIMGHDYNRKWPGVVGAVDAAFGLQARVYPGSIWSVRL